MKDKNEDEVKMEGNPLELIKELIENKEQTNDTIHAHYGADKDKTDELARDILCTIIKAEKVYDVLDKFFSDLNAEQRVRVHEYACAMSMHDIFEKALRDFRR